MWRGRTRTVGWVWLAVATLTVAMTAACYTVADPHAGYAKPIDPTTLGDMSRGVVIDGICPAEIEPVTVASDSRNSNWGHDRELRATAHSDKIVLNWEAPDVPNLSGYIVARERAGSDFDDRFQIFRIEEFASIGQQEEFADSDGIETATWYRYRVFPLTSEGLEIPSASVTIWSPPDAPPPAPSYVNARRNTDGQIGVGVGFGFHAWEKGIRIARRSAGESEWRILHEEPPGNDRDHVVDEHDYWADDRVNARKSHQYAVCVSNTHGYGRATLADSSGRLKTVQVGPPRNLKSVASQDGFTVYWDPVDNESVTGYEMERMGVCRENPYRAVYTTSDAEENYASCSYSSSRKSSRTQRTRVRATIENGHGPWSDFFEVDTSSVNADASENSLPEIVSLNASYDAVYGVWSTQGVDGDSRYTRDGQFKDIRYRILRRRAGQGGEYQAYDRRGQWVDLGNFDWHQAPWRIQLGWSDDRVHPDTEYEYAVQMKIGDAVHPPSEPKLVRTDQIPPTKDRRPFWVHDFRATPTDRGFALTWELPEDPTLTGLQLLSYCEGGRAPCYTGGPVLPPDATSYLVRSGDYSPHVEYCFWLRTVNDYGFQSTRGNRLCVDGGELSHCQASDESISSGGGGGYSDHFVIGLLNCEVSRVKVIRHEFTADGFEATVIDEPCNWTPFPVGWPSEFDDTNVLSWRFADFDIKPGTWYVYEIRQIFGNGGQSVTFHSRVSSKWWRGSLEDRPPCDYPEFNRRDR